MSELNHFLQNNLFFLVLVILFFFIIFSTWNLRLQHQLNHLKKNNALLFTGKKVTNLEELLLSQAKTLRILDKDIQELYNISNQINNLSFRSLHKIGLVRFNPFKDVGGNQSFSLALLNGRNDGLIINSLFTREGTRIYFKSITAGKSQKHPLTEEDQEAIQKALKKNKLKKTPSKKKA